MSIGIIEIITYTLILLAFLHFRKYNDEFLFLPILFFWTTGLQRFNAVLEQKADWVEVAYTFNIFTAMTNTKAMIAMGYFLLGTALFFFSYQFYNKKLPYPEYARDNQDLFAQFIATKKSFILGFFIFFLMINTAFKGMMGGNLAMGQSYFYLFAMGIASFILLGYLVYKVTPKENQGIRNLYIIMISYGMWLSYSPSKRFQFLSWMIALGIIIMQKYEPMQKAKYYLVGGFAVMIFFSLAGVARKHNLSQLSFGEMYELVMERSDSREDQNMLDGFMMVLDVYPHHLDYHYGMEHMEILMRPIPRALWPGKPVGGYANKLGLNDYENSGTVGISQTIYGTFYGEGGLWGIIILSIIYGWVFVKLFRLSYHYNSDLQWLIKGIIIASFVPILRGGDLPGIIAFIGMSYWPIFLIIWQYHKFLAQQSFSEEEDWDENEIESNEVLIN
ncbi:hypothetical protein [Labilibacter marinus]|uniref:hypothetical protein n=1 Tax=Labilibacter marinus TaxID=1477105 RepID=UPI000835D029|nr:hypothetical protein [Labilibacter marinus]